MYSAKHLPNYIRKNELYRKGQMDEALVESFVEFDRTITRYWSLFWSPFCLLFLEGHDPLFVEILFSLVQTNCLHISTLIFDYKKLTE